MVPANRMAPCAKALPSASRPTHRTVLRINLYNEKNEYESSGVLCRITQNPRPNTGHGHTAGARSHRVLHYQNYTTNHLGRKQGGQVE